LSARRRSGEADDGGRSRWRRVPYGLVRALATLVDLITGAVAVVIVLGIAFVVLKANRHNDIVSTVRDVARWLVGPFDGMFTPKHHHRLAVAINWGIATAVYVIAGRFVASLLRRSLPGSP
jgi:CDP-diglyceride synthetase